MILSCCQYPTKCCTSKYSEPTAPDECRCGRGASNGISQVLLSQLFLFAGLWFSAATIGDCNLITVDEPLLVRPDNVTTTSLGIFSYMNPDSKRCYFWNTDEITINGTLAIKEMEVDGNEFDGIFTTSTMNGNEQFLYYLQEVLGADWMVAIVFCVVAYGLSVLLFLYAISYYCSTQVKACRCFASLLVGFCLPMCQALGMIFVYTSEWCDREGCQMGRGTYFSIAAAVCFLFAGICFSLMEHWPGQKVLDDMQIDRSWETEKPKRRQSRKSRHSRNDGNTGHNYHPKNRNSQNGPPRSFSGDAWVIDVEKSAGETFEGGDPSEHFAGDEPDQEQAPPPGYTSSKLESAPPPSPKTTKRNNHDEEPPQSPLPSITSGNTANKRRSFETNKAEKNKKKTNRNPPDTITKDPSGIVVDATTSTAALYEESERIEDSNPTVND